MGDIIETALDLTGADKGNIQLFDDGVLRIIEQRGFDAAFLDYFNSVEYGEAACGSALERKERVIVETVATSPIFADKPARDVLLAAHVQAVQSTPLASRSGQMLGMFSTHYVKPKRPSERDLHVLDILGRQAADLIERSLAELELRRNGETLTRLIDLCPFGIYIVDSDFKIARMNRRSQEGSFINVRPVVGRPFGEAMRVLWPEPVAAEIIGRFRATLDSGDPFYSRDFIRPRGDIAQIEGYEWELHRVTLPDGRFGVICYYYDSTELRNTERALRDMALELEQTFETVATGLTRCGRDMRYVSCNTAYAELAGVPAQRIAGRPIAEVMGREAFDVIQPYIERVLRGERVEYETELPWSESGPKWIHVVYLPWREPDGSISGWVASVNDITARKSIEEYLRRANQDLEQFAYSASHDLQEPLRSIKIYTEVLTMACRGKLDAEAVEALDFVHTGATRMEMLLQGLLTYTQASRIEGLADPINAGQCLDAALNNLGAAIAESGAKVEAGALPSVPVHSIHLQQLFQNLIGNAIKYRMEGVPPIVQVSAEKENGKWRFGVRDNGIGNRAGVQRANFWPIQTPAYQSGICRDRYRTCTVPADR